MVTVIDKRTKTAWISNFFNPKFGKRIEIGTEIKNWVQPQL